MMVIKVLVLIAFATICVNASIKNDETSFQPEILIDFADHHVQINVTQIDPTTIRVYYQKKRLPPREDKSKSIYPTILRNLTDKKTIPTSSVNDNDDRYKIYLKYYPLTVYRLVFDRLDGDKCQNRPVYGHSLIDELELCSGDVYAFSRFDEEPNDRDDLNDRYKHCIMKKEQLIQNGHKDISGLLPYVPYMYSYEASLKDTSHTLDEVSVDEVNIGGFCLKDSIPLFAPLSDISSYELLETNQKGLRRVKLFYKPVPVMYHGTNQINTVITCFNISDNHIVYNYTDNRSIGSHDVDYDFPEQDSFLCELRSQNRLGLSANNSLISIPKKEDYFSIPKQFRLHSTLKDNQVFLRWNLPDIDPKTKLYTYTIYWCPKESRSKGICDKLSGMVKTREIAYTLILPRWVGSSPQFRYGITIHATNGSNSSIYWAQDCEIDPDPTIKIKTVTPVSNDTVELSWLAGSCGKNSDIDNYTLQYCYLRQHDPCVTVLDLCKEEKVDWTNNCPVYNFKNDLTTIRKLMNLEAHSCYAFRIRYTTVFNNTPNDNWSLTEFASTAPADSSNSSACRLRLVVSLSIFVVLLVILMGFSWIKAKSLFDKIFAIRSNFKDALSMVPQLYGQTFELEHQPDFVCRKYWTNHYVPGLHGDVCAGSTETLNNNGGDLRDADNHYDNDNDDDENGMMIQHDNNELTENQQQHNNDLGYSTMSCPVINSSDTSIGYVRPSVIEYIPADRLTSQDNVLLRPIIKQTSKSDSGSDLYAMEADDTDEEAFINGVLGNSD